MKISIITVNLNNACGLRRTIESVACQIYTDFEYIIVDGASTDESLDVIKQFEVDTTSHPYTHIQFSWISESDCGVFQAMNKGILLAKGEYVLFLNSGDFLKCDNVLEQAFKENPLADILCGMCFITKKGEFIHTTNPPDTFRLSHFYNASISHQSTLIKRNLFNTFGLYREDLKFKSDWEFWIRTIILGSVSTTKLDIIISEYNMDGISSDEKNLPLMVLEMLKVYSEFGLDNIISDYQFWEQERMKMNSLYWLKSNKTLNWFVERLYFLAVKIKNARWK